MACRDLAAPAVAAGKEKEEEEEGAGLPAASHRVHLSGGRSALAKTLTCLQLIWLRGIRGTLFSSSTFKAAINQADVESVDDPA